MRNYKYIDKIFRKFYSSNGNDPYLKSDTVLIKEDNSWTKYLDQRSREYFEEIEEKARRNREYEELNIIIKNFESKFENYIFTGFIIAIFCLAVSLLIAFLEYVVSVIVGMFY